MSLPTGFEGLVLTGAQAPVTNLPQGFKGIVLSFSEETLFITVKNGLGKPLVGLEVNTPYSGSTLVGYTDENGACQILCDATGSITFKKDKTFRSKSYSRVTEGNLIEYVYNIPMME